MTLLTISRSTRSLLLCFLTSIALVSSGAFLGGCASESVDESDPAQLYQQAEKDIGSARYQIAIDRLREVRNKFPYSKFSAAAQLRMGDVYFLQESYSEAAAAYESFRDLHPKHEKVPYALFRIGESYYNDIPSPIARDLTPAQKATDAFREFLKRFPNDENAAKAKELNAKAYSSLADKELYIADFYFREESYMAAQKRYEKVIAVYPDTDAGKKAVGKLELTKPKAAAEKIKVDAAEAQKAKDRAS